MQTAQQLHGPQASELLYAATAAPGAGAACVAKETLRGSQPPADWVGGLGGCGSWLGLLQALLWLERGVSGATQLRDQVATTGSGATAGDEAAGSSSAGRGASSPAVAASCAHAASSAGCAASQTSIAAPTAGIPSSPTSSVPCSPTAGGASSPAAGAGAGQEGWADLLASAQAWRPKDVWR